MQERIAAVLADHDYQAASAMAGDLAWIYLRSGQFDKALRTAERCIGYTRQTRWGPWTQLGDEVQRLQILAFTGQAEQVLSDVERLRAQVDAWPDTGNQPETVKPWTVRERLLDVGRTATLQLKRWAQALELNTLEQSVHAAAADLQRFPDAAEVPGDVAELCRRVSEVPGARLGELLDRLAPDPEARQRRLGELITQIGREAATSTETPSTPPSP